MTTRLTWPLCRRRLPPTASTRAAAVRLPGRTRSPRTSRRSAGKGVTRDPAGDLPDSRERELRGPRARDRTNTRAPPGATSTLRGTRRAGGRSPAAAGRPAARRHGVFTPLRDSLHRWRRRRHDRTGSTDGRRGGVLRRPRAAFRSGLGQRGDRDSHRGGIGQAPSGEGLGVRSHGASGSRTAAAPQNTASRH